MDLLSKYFTKLSILIARISHLKISFSFVKRRNDKVIKRTVQSTAIVTSLFPSNVRDRLYKEQEDIENNRKQNRRLASFLHDGDIGLSRANISISTSKPLADLFTESTVLVSNIHETFPHASLATF